MFGAQPPDLWFAERHDVSPLPTTQPTPTPAHPAPHSPHPTPPAQEVEAHLNRFLLPHQYYLLELNESSKAGYADFADGRVMLGLSIGPDVSEARMLANWFQRRHKRHGTA